MHAMGSDPDYSAWIGRTEERADTVTAVPVAALAAALDRDDPAPEAGTLLPPLWHWLYFLPVHRQSELGPDGHPRRGGFLPRSRCRAACGPAAGCASRPTCASATR
jgi:3-methylfumaryl-CoA hydratase